MTIHKSRRASLWQPGLLVLALAAVAGSSPGGERPAAASSPQTLQQATGVAWILDTDPASGAITFAMPKEGAIELPAAGSRAEAGLGFLSRHRRVFGMQDPEHEWVVARQSFYGDGSAHVRFAQQVDHVPVHGATWDVHFDARGRLTSTSGTYVAGAPAVSTRPRLSADAAAARARLCVAERVGLSVDDFTTREVQLEIYPRHAHPVLAWRVPVVVSRSSRASPFLSRTVHLDDGSGTVVAEEPSIIRSRATRGSSGWQRPYPAHCLPADR